MRIGISALLLVALATQVEATEWKTHVVTMDDTRMVRMLWDDDSVFVDVGCVRLKGLDAPLKNDPLIFIGMPASKKYAAQPGDAASIEVSAGAFQSILVAQLANNDSISTSVSGTWPAFYEAVPAMVSSPSAITFAVTAAEGLINFELSTTTAGLATAAQEFMDACL
jgi:hypothetical protein